MKNVILTNPSYTVDHPGDQNYVQDAIAHSGIKRFVVLGILSVALFVGGSAYWAVNSKLEGAVVAPASLVVEGNRKTVEHLEGGIVRNILAVEGQMVEAGQTLLELDSTDLDVNLDVLKSQLGDLVARRARLLAQIGAYSTQKSLFDAELQTLALETALQNQQIEGLRQQISGLMEQRTSNARQLEITNEELGNLETLFERGLVAGTRVTSRRVEIERLNGIDASLRTQEAQIDNQISELMLTNLGEQKLRNETISTELAQIEALLTSLEPQYVGATERLKRPPILRNCSSANQVAFFYPLSIWGKHLRQRAKSSIFLQIVSKMKEPAHPTTLHGLSLIPSKLRKLRHWIFYPVCQPTFL